ncbi:cysteine desulfurase [Candidatus Gottesmanbacteria bacterium CG11_big_fil_rev_8_21_14_0_20_37_11]|uniref:Cysteine desulfurase n=2 Tax=Candidatus Gottesmaniibacteriota TaxID=1752720 RepID=A0A1J4TRE4_9BACT|nr:MAG: cysteine desulfurase [Candidatus Gottesmanbacteria bacterium CG1_02_37_22]PIP33079.1 MAG: cysteine desulfurase [Candidatus Gottesmanbacteria bacterium CG23_combo_of_CG06-09_8_20_14_all_37_19]PIR07922.1 MAG: cysteine desulfurase [Candidatus Gottesmanbacteria bacterium CG11_big_fil_rev_8_21_14_0_20_37_11]
MFDVVSIRNDFPILKRKINGKPLVYLDNAATTQKPKQVIDALVSYYENHNANIHRGIHTLAEEATAMYEEAREKIAKFIGARSSKEIVFVRNSTEAINLVAYSWGRTFLNRGDEIILSESEHHSNLVPWQILSSEKGLKLRFVGVDENGYLEIPKLEKLINKRTKLIAIVHVSNVLGTINPVEKIGKMLHKKGVRFLVDGAQSVPRMPIKVVELNCDFLVASSHKMLGPTGVGFLYAKEELLKEMPPFLGGGDMIKAVYLDHSKWNDIPYKFEAGTPDIAGSIGFGKAIDYLTSLGMENVFMHEKKLTDYALRKLLEIRDVTLYGPEDTASKTGVISFNIKGIHPHDVAQSLDREGIAVRSGFHCAMPLHQKLKLSATCRASFYIYNTFEEIDKLIIGIDKLRTFFSKS